MPRGDKVPALLRTLPAVDALVTRVESHPGLAGIPRRRLTEATREVLLSGGSINSPQLLMLSGIGPSSHLAEVGIESKVDLAGVGSAEADDAL